MADTTAAPAGGSILNSTWPKVAYLDCPTGIAGDMCLGAIVDAGMPLTVLTERLAQLGLSHEYQLVAQTVQRQTQVATHVQVKLLTATPDAIPDAHNYKPVHAHDGHDHDHDHGHDAHGHTHDAHSHGHGHHPTYGPSHSRHLPEIEALIRAAQLTDRATAWSLAIFHRLAEAEAAVHGIAPEQVHFHEVGATDAIVDIVGTCIGLDWLGVERLYCSALPVGGGTVMAAHGRLPVPAPAVLRLLTQAQARVYSNGIDKELVTPTGAAIATTLSAGFGSPPPMALVSVGYGAGGRDLPIANVLRLWLGQETAPDDTIHSHAASVDSVQDVAHDAFPNHGPNVSASTEPKMGTSETVVELQTQVDDLTPQAVGYLYEPLFAAGALDVFTQSVGMKKNRPGLLLTVVCHTQQADSCTKILFKETTTLGVRQSTQQRHVLHREYQQIATPYGDIQIKIARSYPGGPMLNLHPEYEDCARCARQQGVAWKQVYQAAIAQALEQLR